MDFEKLDIKKALELVRAETKLDKNSFAALCGVDFERIYGSEEISFGLFEVIAENLGIPCEILETLAIQEDLVPENRREFFTELKPFTDELALAAIRIYLD